MASKIISPRILIEGIVIVVSILLAFGIDAWWDEQGRMAQEKVLLAALTDDLRQDHIDYTRFTSIQSDRILAIDFLLALAADPAGNRENASTAKSEGMTTGDAFSLLGRLSMLETVLVSYDQMTSAGASSVIDDPVLWREISEYYALARDNLDANNINSSIERYRTRLETLGWAVMDGERIPADEVLADSQLRAQIRNIRPYALQSMNIGESMIELTIDLIEEVESRLP